MDYDVIVVGGGASGLMAAGTAAGLGKRVCIIEKNERPARKVMITGKGRCNVTNDTDVNGLIASVTRNAKFLYSSFRNFSAEDTKTLFTQLGVPLKTERGNRVFPVSDKAVDIVDALVKYAKNAELISDTVTELLFDGGSVIGVNTKSGKTVFANSVILATGGLSYPLTGSTGDGYEFAKSAGHTVSPLYPSLVPLNAHEGWVSDLSGLTLKNIAVLFFEEGKPRPVYTDFGELMFAHFGITGPTVLSASAHLDPEKIDKYTAVIDLKPALDENKLDARILRDFSAYGMKDLKNAMIDLLPSRLIPVVIRQAQLDPARKVSGVTKEERRRIISALKGLKITVTGFRPISEAVVTRGGVNVKEIDPATMESKICRGLYFAGELIDVDAYTGGFNLQIAFATGYTAGLNA